MPSTDSVKTEIPGDRRRLVCPLCGGARFMVYGIDKMACQGADCPCVVHRVEQGWYLDKNVIYRHVMKQQTAVKD